MERGVRDHDEIQRWINYAINKNVFNHIADGHTCVECTGSRLSSEVKQHRAQLVQGWGTAWEDLRVLSAFSFSHAGMRRCFAPLQKSATKVGPIFPLSDLEACCPNGFAPSKLFKG